MIGLILALFTLWRGPDTVQLSEKSGAVVKISGCTDMKA